MTSSLPAQARPGPAIDASRIRVMICDDSAVVRGLIGRLIQTDPALEIIHSVGDGEAAIRALQRASVDVIILDIEMPVMDGLTAVPKLLQVDRDVKIIIASTLSQRNARVSLQAMQLGASDYVPKPSSSAALHSDGDFKSELLGKIQALGAKRRAQRGGVAKPADVLKREAAARAAVLKPVANIVLRKPSLQRPKVLAVGSSTGGPQALQTFFATFPALIDIPIFVTQHMPASFTAILAEHLTRTAQRDAKEAVENEIVRPGRIYVAPGGVHMIVQARGNERVIRLTQDPPENFCRPAVDPMFRSIAACYGAATLAVVLTGMGADGAKGGKAVADAGGTVLAQDEATSVVWGMPGATAQLGVCSAVLPIGEMAAAAARYFQRGAA
jgi:two-component system chemotaxis response regulator CheB